MRGVRNLSGLAGPNASLKDAGGGGGVGIEIVGSATASSTSSFPSLDLSALTIEENDTIVIFASSYYGPYAILDQGGDNLHRYYRSSGYTYLGGNNVKPSQNKDALLVYKGELAAGQTTVTPNYAGHSGVVSGLVVRGKLGRFRIDEGTPGSSDFGTGTNGAGALVFAVEAGAAGNFNGSATPPTGFTSYGLLSPGSGNVAMYASYKENASANETPSRWGHGAGQNSYNLAINLSFEVQNE